MENHGLAIADATVALELDKTFIKAYCVCNIRARSTHLSGFNLFHGKFLHLLADRRGSAYMALARYKDALRDFKTVRHLKPSDKDALEKFRAADKEVPHSSFYMSTLECHRPRQ